MKKILLLVCWCAFSNTAFGAEGTTRYYREIVNTLSMPYHFEGLFPVPSPQSHEEYYEFIFNRDSKPIQITYYKDGKVADNPDGWALFKLSFDPQGHLKESSFYKANGKSTSSKTLCFSREQVDYESSEKPNQTFYNAKGKIILTPQKDWRTNWDAPMAK